MDKVLSEVALKHKVILDSNMDAVICMDAAGRIFSWNTQAEKIFGWKASAVIGKTVAETIVPPQDKERHIKGLQHYLATGEGALLNKIIEIFAVNKEGNHFPVELTVIPLLEHGISFFCAFVRDITHRKSVEASIQLSHKRLQDAERIGKTGYWHWDTVTGLVTWSEGTYNVFGEKQGNFKESYDDFMRRICSGEKEMVQNKIQQVYETKIPGSYEFWIDTPSDGQRFITTTAEVILDENDNVIAMFGTTRDITEQRKAQEKERKHAELQSIFATLNKGVHQARVPDEIYDLALNALQNAIRAEKACILLFDDNNIMRFVACRNLSDRYKQAVEGHSPWPADEKDAKPVFISDVRKEPTLKNLLQVISAEGIAALGFIPLIHQQKLLGKLVVYFSSIHHFTDDEAQVIQNIAGVVAFAIWEKKSEITLRESEAKYRAFFENSMDGILLTSPDGNVFAANPAACEMFRMTEKEICLAGRTDLVDKDDPRLLPLLQRRSEKGKIMGELNFIRKDGSKFSAEISSSVFIDANNTEKTSMIIRDITERKKNENEIKKQKEQYDELVKNIPVGVYKFRMKADGRMSLDYISPRLCKMIGVKEESAYSDIMNTFKVIHPDDFKGFTELIEESYNTKQRFLWEGRAIINGQLNWVKVESSPKALNDGDVLWDGVISDITERKKTESALEESYSVLEATLESTTDGILVVNAAGKIIRYNKKFSELWNIPDTILSSGDDAAAIDYVLKQLRSPEKFLAKIKELYSQPDAISFDILEFQDDRIFERYSQPHVINGKSVGRVWSFRDVTIQNKIEKSLRESEQRIRHVLSSTADNFYVIDRNFRVTIISESAEKNLEIAWGKPVRTNTNILEVIPSDSLVTIKNNLEKVFSGEQIEYELNQTIKRLPEWVHVIYQPVSDEMGNITGAYIVSKDITERKKAEEKLRSSEELLLASIENTPNVAIQWYNRKGEVVFWNHASENVFGFSAEEAMGKTLDQLIHTPEAAAEFVHTLGTVEKTGETVGPAEYSFTRRDGSVGHCVSTIFSIPSVAGESRFVCMDVDVTERKKVEEELIKSKKQFQSLIENISGVYWVNDLIQNRTLYISPSFETIWGRKCDDLYKDPAAFIDAIHPEDKERVFDAYRNIRHSAQFSISYRFIRPDGAVRWIFVRINVFSDEGRILEYGYAEDITEQKKAEQELKISEERYRSLVEQASDGILVTDLQGTILDMNSRLCSMFGYSKEETINKNVVQFLHPENIKQQPLRYSQLQGDSSMLLERLALHKDGTVFDIELNTKLIGDNKALSVIRNVTERKKAEQLIRESEERYKALVENAPEALVVFDLRLRKFVSVSESAEKLFKMTQEELLQVGPVEMSPEYQPDGRLSSESAMEKIKAAIDGHKPSFEWTHHDREGNLIPCEVRLVRLPSETELLIRGSIIDITERKKVEKALKESEEKYKSVIEQATDFIIITDEKGKLIDANSSFLKAFGYTREEAINMSINFFIDPEQLKTDPVNFAALLKGESVQRERRMIDKKGTIIEVEANVKMLPDGRMMAIVRDIRERKKAEQALKESEEKYRTLVEQASDPILMYSLDGKILDYNHAFMNATGYQKENLREMNLMDLLFKEDLKTKPLIFTGIKKGFSVHDERRIRRKDGSAMPVELNSKMMPDGNIMVIGRDVTERKKAEKELEDSYTAIRKLTEHLQNIREEERKHIAREIHDELGQQLTVMKMDISWINKKLATLGEEAIREKAKELMEMIDQTVKTIRRISSELRPSLLDDLGLTAAMEWQLHEFERRSDIKTGLQILTGNTNNLHDNVKTGLFRIFQESLTNVARHSNAKKVDVVLSQKEDRLILSIKDDGYGFDKQKIAEKKTLGILGMKERTSMIGGTYEITSNPGKGTNVVVTIPLVQQ